MRHFTYQELTRSATASRLGIANIPNQRQRRNLRCLVEAVLDPVRTLWGKPLLVTSGYRCEALNKAVGGVPDSQHKEGNAADITTGNAKDNERLFNLIINSNIAYDQLIGEQNFRWLHISHNSNGANRNQAIML